MQLSPRVVTSMSEDEGGSMLAAAANNNNSGEQQDSTSGRWGAARADQVRLRRSRSSGTVRGRVRRIFQASTAVHMHSVGVLGRNEHLDNAGSLLQTVSVQKEKRPKQEPAYGELAPQMEEEEEEEVQIEVVEGGSLVAAVFGIIKGTVGPAILYLPRGFRQSGWAVAIPSLLLATGMFVYNAFRLLECWKVESDKNHAMAAHIDQTISYLNMDDDHTTIPDYTPVLLTYGELARRGLGKWSFLIKMAIALFQFGVVVSYFIFVTDNLQECVSSMTGYNLPKILFLALMLAIEIPMSWIVDIRKLTPCNVVATVLIAFGLCAILGMAFTTGLQSPDSEDIAFVENLRTFPMITDMWFLFVGTSFFVMEGSMTLVVPLQEAVFLKEDRDAFPRTNAIVTLSIVLFFITFSLICGAAFGESIRTVLTASLKGALAHAVQLSYSMAVILTFPLQLFPAMQVACTAVMGRRVVSDTSHVERSVLATVIVLVLGWIAVVSIDYLGNVVSILGSLFGIPLALIFPPLMHNNLVNDLTRRRRFTNYCVVAVGVFAMGASSYATIQNWNNNTEGG